MIVKALDLNTNQYIDVNVTQAQYDKKGRIKHLIIERNGFEFIYKRTGKDIYYTVDETLSINEAELKGVGA